MYLYQQKKPNGDVYLAIKEKYLCPRKRAPTKGQLKESDTSANSGTGIRTDCPFSGAAAELTKEKAEEKNRTVQD